MPLGLRLRARKILDVISLLWLLDCQAFTHQWKTFTRNFELLSRKEKSSERRLNFEQQFPLFTLVYLNLINYFMMTCLSTAK
jgi:hypothetical protein